MRYTSSVQTGYDDGNSHVKEVAGIDQNFNDLNFKDKLATGLK